MAPDDAREVLKDPAGASASVVDPKALNLHQRLHAVMMDVDYVQKDKKIEVGGGYKVVTHDAVTGKVRPALVKHRVAYYPQNLQYQQNGNRTEITLTVDFVNIDDPKDRISVPTIGFGIDPGDKGPGKAVSYAVKYALLKALGLETGEDADDVGDTKHEDGRTLSAGKPGPVAADVPAQPKSPPGITKVKQEVREAIREMRDCEDGDQLMTLLETPDMKRLAVKVCRDFSQEWRGEEEFSGLRGGIEFHANRTEVAPGAGNYIRKVEQAAKEPQK